MEADSNGGWSARIAEGTVERTVFPELQLQLHGALVGG